VLELCQSLRLFEGDHGSRLQMIQRSSEAQTPRGSIGATRETRGHVPGVTST